MKMYALYDTVREKYFNPVMRDEGERAFTRNPMSLTADRQTQVIRARSQGRRSQWPGVPCPRLKVHEVDVRLPRNKNKDLH